MVKLPRMADVSCKQLRFRPGDRILARSYFPLDADAQRKLRRLIRKWAGCEVEILIYDANALDIKVELKGLHGQQGD